MVTTCPRFATGSGTRKLLPPYKDGGPDTVCQSKLSPEFDSVGRGDGTVVGVARGAVDRGAADVVGGGTAIKSPAIATITTQNFRMG